MFIFRNTLLYMQPNMVCFPCVYASSLADWIKFRVYKSVHHHTFKWINQPDAAILQVYYMSFKYSSAVGRRRAGRPARPRPTALLLPRSNGKTRCCYCSCSSWWWAWGCPKHVELYLNDQVIKPWEIAASGWLIHLNVWWCTDSQTWNSTFFPTSLLRFSTLAIVSS